MSGTLLAGMGLALVLAGCGSDGPSCSAVCAKVVECYPEDSQTECLDQCAAMKGVLRSSVYQELGSCMLDTSCAELEQNGDTCMEQATTGLPTKPVDDMLEDLCHKMVECDASDELTVEACLDQMQSEMAEAYAMMGMFKNSVLGCIGSCFKKADCAELAGAEEACMEQCGLDVFMAEDAEDFDSAGNGPTD
jgi:hypothetical protein